MINTSYRVPLQNYGGLLAKIFASHRGSLQFNAFAGVTPFEYRQK